MNKSHGFSLLELMIACSLLTTVLLISLVILARQGVKIQHAQQHWLQFQAQLNAKQH